MADFGGPGLSARARATGSEVLRSRSSPSGRTATEHVAAVQRCSIPGYVGFVPGRAAENIIGVTHGQSTVASHQAILERGRPEVADGSGQNDTTVRLYHTETDRHLDSQMEFAPDASTGALAHGRHRRVPTISSFRNTNGVERQRAGCSVPGYAGFIPGKKAGLVFAQRFAKDNLAATEVRRQRDPPHTGPHALPMSVGHLPPWAVDANSSARGLGATRRIGRTGEHPGGWRLFEPHSTHEIINY